MPKIDMGGFGYRTPQSSPITPTAQVDSQVADATARLGNVALAVGDQLLTDERQKEDALARSRAGDALLDHEVKSKTAVEAIKDRVQRGELPYGQARDELRSVLDGFEGPALGPQHKLVGEQYARGIKRQRFLAESSIDQVVDTAQRAELKAGFVNGLDQLGKLALMPGSNLDEIMSKADAVAVGGRTAGIPDVDKQVQGWKDSIRYRIAQNDLIAVRRDPAALESYQRRLSEGDLAGSLDPDKKVILIKEAESYRWQAQNAAQHLVDRQEKIAERSVAKTTRQIEEGVPLTVEGWEAFRRDVQGTSYASDFNALVKQERETQQVLRMPLAQQEQYVQEREAKLMQEGGTSVDKANLQRIRTTVETNRKQLEQAPLVAAQRLYGRTTAPLDLMDLLQPGGVQRAAELFNDRATTLQTMQQQFGARVGAKPLLPQEATMLVKLVDGASPSEASQLFGALRSAIGDDQTYRATMQQIAPDSPVKARAGLLSALRTGLVIERNLIADDKVIPSDRVAQTILAGEQILHKSKGQKSDDGQGRTMFSPNRDMFSAEFADAVGDLYRGRSQAQEADLQVALAYYTGRASELGRMTRDAQDVDSKLVKEAIAASLGTLVNFNGHGQVKAPLGMSADVMEGKVREQFAGLVKQAGLPASMLTTYDSYGLVNYRRDGQYVMTLGGLPVVNPKSGQPLVIDLDPPPVSGPRFGRTAGADIPGQAPGQGPGQVITSKTPASKGPQ